MVYNAGTRVLFVGPEARRCTRDAMPSAAATCVRWRWRWQAIVVEDDDIDDIASFAVEMELMYDVVLDDAAKCRRLMMKKHARACELPYAGARPIAATAPARPIAAEMTAPAREAPVADAEMMTPAA